MRIFKAQYKDKKTGKTIKSRKWYIDFTDHLTVRHRLPAFDSKRASEAFGRQIEALVNHRLSSQQMGADVEKWLSDLPERFLKSFVRWGLISGQRAEAVKSIEKHLEDYRNVLSSRNVTKSHITRAVNRVKSVCRECRFQFFRDISRASVEIYLGKMKKKGYSATSRGHYLDALKTFLNWAKDDCRISYNPIETLKKESRDSKLKGILTREQFVKLITNTIEKNILRGRTTGLERGLMYFIAGTTGLRRKELLQLQWQDIFINDTTPFIRARSATTKNKKEARQPIPAMLAELLQSHRDNISFKDRDRIFPSFGQWINTADLIRADLENARIDLYDKDGNEIVFHSLRNSYISFLANSNTPAKTVQKLARHADPRLTFNTYARSFEESEQKAVAMLPDLGQISNAIYLAKNCLQERINTNKFDEIQAKRQWAETAPNCSETAVSKPLKPFQPTNSKIAPRGFEPLSPG